MTESVRPNGPTIGHITLANNVFLAPMSGVSDLAFRGLARRLGAGLVFSEMIASQSLARTDDEAMLRSTRDRTYPFAIQLAGREAHWMTEGARRAEALGADLIDINMGCPARQVTRGLSGSALMRDPDHALTLIEAVVGAVDVPVTLKMRMGWDDASLNAVTLARRAEAAGVAMITVHGRTRCQFFKGRANWDFIAGVKRAVTIPVVANGDITTLDEARDCLERSGADAIMIGRGACGAPWLPGRIAGLLGRGIDPGEPTFGERADFVLEQFEAMCGHYGTALGLRRARKHLAWYVTRSALDDRAQRGWRDRLCRCECTRTVRREIAAFFDCAGEAAS